MASIHSAMDKQLYCEVLLLLERLPEVDVKDDKGMTILMKCCYIDDVRTVRVIAKRTLKYGADINATDLSGKDALCHTTIANNVTLAKLLLKSDNLDLIRKDNDGNTALHLAAIRGHVTIIQMITSPIRKYRLPVDVRNNEGMTPLMLACRHGRVETAHFLVNRCNASLTMRDDVKFMTARDWLDTALIVPSDRNIFDNVPNVKKYREQDEQSSKRENTDYRNGKATINRMVNESDCTSTKNIGHPEGKSHVRPSRERRLPGGAEYISVSISSVPEGAASVTRRTTSDPGQRSSRPSRDGMLINLFNLYAAQCSPSYRPPAKAPTQPVPQQTKHDEVRSRKQVTRSRFQKLMRMKRAESIIASLRRGATARNEATWKSSDKSPRIQHVMDNPFSASKQSKSTAELCRDEKGCTLPVGTEGESETH